MTRSDFPSDELYIQSLENEVRCWSQRTAWDFLYGFIIGVFATMVLTGLFWY